MKGGKNENRRTSFRYAIKMLLQKIQRYTHWL